jgi:hypothetical protein
MIPANTALGHRLSVTLDPRRADTFLHPRRAFNTQAPKVCETPSFPLTLEGLWKQSETPEVADSLYRVRLLTSLVL